MCDVIAKHPSAPPLIQNMQLKLIIVVDRFDDLTRSMLGYTPLKLRQSVLYWSPVLVVCIATLQQGQLNILTNVDNDQED